MGALFKKLNFLPIILPIQFDYKKYFNSIKIDGIILSGGNDLNIIHKNSLSFRRDRFEKNN